MVKTLAIYNLKGGVGKTATAVNLAYLASRDGYRVLLWDLDPQAAASFYFRLRPKVDHSARSDSTAQSSAPGAITSTNYPQLDFLPADFSQRDLDLELPDFAQLNKYLRHQVSRFADYDFVFLDCAPSISRVAENVFHAADALLIPLIPTHLSLRTYDHVCKFCAAREYPTAVRWPFFSMVDRRRRLHRELVSEFVISHPEVLSSYIPYASEVEKMGVHRAPVPEYARNSGPARAFAALWQKVKQRCANS